MGKRKSRTSSNRGLHYRRVDYRPGFGICLCRVCRAAVEAAGHPFSPNHQRRGSPVEGCEYVNRERVFAELWETTNEHKKPGVLQALMTTHREAKEGDLAVSQFSNPFRQLRVAFRITQRDWVIVATIIQWLGTNIGWWFLGECLGKCGFVIVRKEELDALYEDQQRLHKVEKLLKIAS